MSRLKFLLLVTTLGLVWGCRFEAPTPVLRDVSGKVTHKGTPIKRGQIGFEEPNTGYSDTAEVGEGGTYTLKLPDGEYRVWVEPPLVLANPQDPDGGSVYGKADDIPKKYVDMERSGLSAAVSATSVTFDFDMN